MIKECTISRRATLLETLKALSASGEGIALVVDENNRLEGVATDGDIRRALLKGAVLTDVIAPYMTTNYRFVSPDRSRADVLDLMQAQQLRHIPIVSAGKELMGVHLLRKMIARDKKPNWAVVMAGGKGTRLHPITEKIPKPMIEVAGRPILERIVLHLVGHGIQRIFLSVNHCSEMIESHFGDGRQFGCRIDYIRETEPLGTAGSLSQLPEGTDDPVLVMNGDIVSSADFSAMLNYHEVHECAMTMAVKNYSHQVPYGCVEIRGGFVTELEEKPAIEKMVNAGIYVLNPDVIRHIPAEYYPITEVANSLLRSGRRVGAFDLLNEWIDIGHHDQLRRARQGY